MALLNIYRGTDAKCNSRPISDGTLLFAIDTRKIYLDNGQTRIEVASLQDLSDYVTSNELEEGLNTKAPLSHSHSASQITSGTLPITHGGTGATSSSGALTNLGAAGDDVITISTSQPTSSTCMLWVKP